MSAKKSKRAVTKKRTRSARPKDRHYDGPLEWLSPMLEEAYTRLQTKDDAAAPDMNGAAAVVRGVTRKSSFMSAHQKGKGASVLAALPRTHWEEKLLEFKRRKAEVARPRAKGVGLVAGMPVVPGQNNWTPIGPSVVARGQTQNRAAISGRVSGIAIAPGGMRMYVATANGGVWRSDDAGKSWASTMEGFDVNPTSAASASLVCGAIAIDPADPDRIYVGTGEGDTDGLFAIRIVNALPAYRGIGPIRSDNGGMNWVQEASTPSLAGFSFYQIAVDPADREHCVAATTNGLYERVPVAGGFNWTRRRTGIHTAVVVARTAGVTSWFAAPFGGPVVTSANGNAWATIGTGFPAGVGRVALGVQPDNPNVLYALIAASSGALNSVRRLDGMAGSWKNISGAPSMLNGSQGVYDLCIAVDPSDVNRIYLGGDYFNADPYPGSIWRGTVTPSGTAYSMAATSIGQQAHADVHVLLHTPADPNKLWTGTDGGLFLNPNPTAAGSFESRNTGLSTLCTTFFAQHPTEPAVLFAGLQDNGTARCTGEEVWRHVLFADGGYGVVNWNNPFKVMVYANGNLFRATDGGQGYPVPIVSYGSWSVVTPPTSSNVMAAPLVSAPYNPGSMADAEVVAFGAGPQIFISTNFGTSWPDVVTLDAGSQSAFSMVFASATRLFVGTTNGRVFRLDKTGAGWTKTRIDNVAAGSLGVFGLLTDIAVDTSDGSLNSIFVSFGGTGNFRHVWRFDGTQWQARSGTAGSGTELLDVEHNALAFDAVTNRLYVGSDIGVWQSADGGNTWTPLSDGLPDAPVYDLQIHPTARLLRACLHGRGLFEWKLDLPVLADVELYVRDTMLDTGRGVNTDGRSDPSIFPTAPVFHYLGPNIKVDVPTPAGYQTPTTAIDFLTFNEVIVDGSNGVGTIAPPQTVHNRVYVEVHNRGRVPATNVQVMVAITNAASGLLLPAGYTTNVVNGTPISGPKWVTLGVQTLANLRAGFPQIAAFDLPSTALPLPASLPGNSHYCLVAFVHSAQDPFTSTQQNADLLTLADRKVAQKNLHIVEFIGVPPPSATLGMWAMLIVRGIFLKEKGPIDLVIDAERFPGTLQFVLPPSFFPKDPAKQAEGFTLGANSVVKRWITQHKTAAEKLYHEAKFAKDQYELLAKAMDAVGTQSPLVWKGGRTGAITALPISPKDEHVIFIRIDLPKGAKVGATYDFDVFQRRSKKGAPLSGSRYQVVVNRPAK